MIGKNIENSSAVTVHAALEMLNRRKKDGELGYEQQLALEHAEKHAGKLKGDPDKLLESLMAMGASRKAAVKVIDVMPSNETQLKQVLVIEKKALPDETIKSIMAELAKYRGK